MRMKCRVALLIALALMLIAGGDTWARKRHRRHGGRAHHSRKARGAARAQKASRAPKAPRAPKASAAPAPAQAGPEEAGGGGATDRRVVVLPFTGPGGAAARAAVVRTLNAVEVDPGAFKSAAKELKVVAEGAGLASVCSKIKCDAVIKGAVTKRGRKVTVAVTVIDGGTGSVVGRRTAAARNVGKVAAAGASLGGQCVPLVTKAQARPGGGDQLVAGRTETAAAPTPAPPTPAPQSQAAADHADIPVYQPSRPSGKHKSDDEEGEGESDDEERLSKRRSGGKGKYDGLFGVSVAFGGAARQAVVAEVTPTVDDANYEGKVYPEVIVSAEVYPAVAFTKSFVRNFGLGVTYSHHLSISTKVGERDLGTSSQELLIDLRYRWPLFNWATPPELLIVAGGGLRDYTLDENDIMTSFNYRFLRFGLDGYVPFGTPLLGVSVGFDVRPLLTVGQEAVNFLGSKSGGLAFAVRGGVRGRLAFGLSYFAELEYLRFGTSFQGLTASGVSDAGKNKRDRAGATDGTDRFIRFWLGAGYAL